MGHTDCLPICVWVLIIMRLFEYEAKAIAKKSGIRIPRGAIATTPEEAKKVFNEIEAPAVLKSQVLIAGRKKAGGIRFVDAADEAYSVAQELLKMEIGGEPVKQLLVEERVPVKKELYLSVTVNRSARCYTILASAEGGVDIEDLATRSPEKVISRNVDPILGFREYHGRDIARQLGYSGKQLLELGSIVTRIFQIAVANDSELTESNPMLEHQNGEFVAADFRMILDDNALYRHPEFQERRKESDRELTELEAKARQRASPTLILMATLA